MFSFLEEQQENEILSMLKRTYVDLPRRCGGKRRAEEDGRVSEVFGPGPRSVGRFPVETTESVLPSASTLTAPTPGTKLSATCPDSNEGERDGPPIRATVRSVRDAGTRLGGGRRGPGVQWHHHRRRGDEGRDRALQGADLERLRGDGEAVRQRSHVQPLVRGERRQGEVHRRHALGSHEVPRDEAERRS